MTPFQKWLVYTICAPIGAILWLGAGLLIPFVYYRITYMLGFLS